MKTWLKITIIVAVLVVIAAVIIYFVSKKSSKPGPNKNRYKVTTAETGLNVRKSADINSEILGTLDKDSEVVVDKIENGWAYLPDYSGWVSMDYLTKI